jgi:cysteinyl-tRNA synthetase
VHGINTSLEKGAPSDDDLKTIWATLWALDSVAGVLAPLLAEIQAETVPDDIKKLVEDREAARRTKQFERSDELRLKIEAAGYTVEDTPTGPRVLKK